MGLTLTRRVGEELLLSVDPDMDPAELAQQLSIGVRLRISNVENGRVSLRIFAPRVVKITWPERFGPKEFGQHKKSAPPGLWGRLLKKLKVGVSHER